MWWGIKRSKKHPNALFHYGFGAERFLFALLSAVGIFVLGCGVSIYHGIHGLLDPHPIEVTWIVWAVLGLSLLVDGFVLGTAVREVNRAKGDQSLLTFIRTSSDPSILAVLFEDLVATLGVLVAGGGILLAQTTGNPMFDALSSIIIGVMLGIVAVWLGYRNRQLLLGQAIPKEMQTAVVDHLKSQDSVLGVRDVKTRILGSDRFRASAEVTWDGRALAERHLEWARPVITDANSAEACDAAAREIGHRVVESLGDEIDRIEKDLQAKFPALKHLDFEAE